MTGQSGHKSLRKITPSCPTCRSSEDVVEIIYGYPDESLVKSGREDFILGGCCICEDSPGWYCRKCQSGFGELRWTDELHPFESM